MDVTELNDFEFEYFMDSPTLRYLLKEGLGKREWVRKFLC